MSHDMSDITGLRRIRLRDLVDDEVFGGATYGEVLLAELISAGRDLPSDCRVLALDFSDVSVATSSFLRTSILAFRAFWQAEQRQSAIVVCNLCQSVEEELDFLLVQGSDAMVACRWVRSRLGEPRVLGKLDQKERECLEALEASDEPMDARAVAMHYGEDVSGGKRFTRWNNLLASLSKKGVLVERTDGRKKLYTFAVRGA